MASGPPARPLLLLVLLVLPVLAPGAAPAGEDESALRARFREQVAAGDWAALLAAADEALGADADSAAALMHRAYALHRLGRKEEALRAYERTLVLEPGCGWAWLNLGELLAGMGRLEEGVRAFERAVALDPSSRDVRERLSRALREGGDPAGAVAATRRALEYGVEPAWCHAELGYLWWSLGNLEAAGTQWKLARKAGADEALCDHGLRLVSWDRLTGPAREREEIGRRRQGLGPEWVFAVGELEVHTRVGPRLPREMERLLEGLQEDYARELAADRDWAGSIRLRLARTLEEHERERMRLFPRGYSGKAFFVASPGRPRRGRGRGAPGAWAPDLDLYVAWCAPGLERSLSHELAHALLRRSTPRAPDLPAWLDEGIATYLELAEDRRGRLASGTIREDLLETLRAALDAGEALPLRNLLFLPRHSFTGPRARARYAQSWSLVHFLLHGNTRDGASRLREYLERIDRGGTAPADAVFSAVYGPDLAALEADWREYVDRLAR